ncbi:MAG TPA: ABC transporter substrate-binding protein [Candidatus Methanomethylophilaceae archaeon]|nr:ABC transporter substrate-binding protein [Candidatus Methanomethylophilaceae archaeon]
MGQENKRKLIIATLGVVTIILLGSLVYVVTDKGSTAEGFQLTDAMDNPLNLDIVPNRVVSTAPSITEQIYSLGLQSKLVAVSDNCDYPGEVLVKKGSGEYANVGSYYSPNVELIINCTPDVVFISNTAGGVTSYEALREAGINVVMLYQEETMEDIYANLYIITVVMHLTAVQEEMENVFDLVRQISADGEPKKLMMNLGYEWGMDQVYLFGTDTFGDDIIKMVNCTNAAGASGFILTNYELLAVEEGGPDIIFVMVQGGWGGQEVYFDETNWNQNMTALQDHPIWGSTTAVQNRDVYFFYGRAASIAQRASPGLADLAKLVCMFTHPEQFAGFEPPKFVGDDYETLLEGYW